MFIETYLIIPKEAVAVHKYNYIKLYLVVKFSDSDFRKWIYPFSVFRMQNIRILP